ncbi:MAG: amino acid decarboxylase [Desulfitobacteriaceae bacterium]|nr:amino acid decarboxylase [Desulfitobacteriaceae bacterium]MDD4345377.1 amino acid decarboxylase [Desulfitobacteriaceae bacterium]MDD4400300.1 amino acid decarboxylase [Desulfitobacteriaceae bacterium]
MPVLGEDLQRYCRQGFRSFHTPGHKGQQEFFRDINFLKLDLTELPGLDQLSSANGIIARAQQRAAQIFGAEESFFLINGGTAGNQAMFLALGEEAESKKVLVGRQSHKSVMSALVLTGLVPEFLTPIIHPEFNLPLGLDSDIEELDWDTIAACHITYPAYYGTIPDLRKLMDYRNKQGATCPFLIDQAHGSHYLGSLFPPSALALGADLVLHSTHKTLSALTQAAMLHVQGKSICRKKLCQSLELLQSSSPSYLLMVSLELAGEFALASERWAVLKEEVEILHTKVGGFLRILNDNDAGTYGIKLIDWSKILINTRSLGIPAPECVDYLRQDHGIEPELWDQENILFVLGIGNTREDIRALTKGLQGLAELVKGSGSSDFKPERLLLRGYPDVVQRMSPRQAFCAPREFLPLQESLGRIAAEIISPYPPGIPLIVMGEEITVETIEILLAGVQGNWQGWDGFKNGMIWVVREI